MAHVDRSRTRALRVGTWNVHEGRHDGGDQSGTHEVVRLIRELDLDVLALQEVVFDGNRSPMLDAIAGRTELRHVEGHPLSPAMCGTGSAGIALAARTPLEDVRRAVLPNPCLVKGDWHSYDKGLMTARLAYSGRMIAVGCLHMVPFHRFGRVAEDPDFGHIWEQAAKEIAYALLPLTFVGGDFNTDRRDLLDLPLVAAHRDGVDTILHSPPAPSRPPDSIPTFSDHPCRVAEFALA
ncbi:endonuclease/exonuclease/phosphatase family protein [Nonomuraea sp. NPDC050451]|uniref:endonuclease/exonuclease/phosphatase family protein n=1 Tax=Nonomuraea sp. NPDC050451 TaxID=3364364 RepID=UPI00378F5C1B